MQFLTAPSQQARQRRQKRQRQRDRELKRQNNLFIEHIFPVPNPPYLNFALSGSKHQIWQAQPQPVQCRLPE